MSTFIAREEPFTCEHCGFEALPLGKGTYRDHCPQCLYSKHVDDMGPGDRASTCLGMLEPLAVDQHGKKGFVIVYRCQACGKEHRNKVSDDDKLAEFMRRKTEGT